MVTIALDALFLATPFWLTWTAAGLGAKYFWFVPEPWRSLPFADCWGLFLVLMLIRAATSKLIVHRMGRDAQQRRAARRLARAIFGDRK